MRERGLRFPIAAAEQARIATGAGELQTADVPLRRDANEPPYTFALQLNFRVTDPEAGPIPLRPVGPGRLTFIADQTDPRPMPQWDQIEFDDAHHADWPTRGVLRLELVPRADQWIFLFTEGEGLHIKPNWIWYGPVNIPLAFLQTTLGVRKERIPGVGNAPTIPVSDPDWAKHAAARFLQGGYHPELRLGVEQADDDVVTLPMPTADMNQNAADAINFGRVTLAIAAGWRATPFDGAQSAFADAPGGNINPALPAHPASGCFPARYFFREVRNGLIDGEAGAALPDLVLGETPAAPKYRVLHVTRTWKPLEDCSVHFPKHTIKLERPPGGDVVIEQWLPSHGLVFVPDDPAQPLGQVYVTLAGGPMRWLVPDSTTPAWRRKGELTAKRLDMLASVPHVIARLPMRDAVMVEKRHESPDVAACTYYSLRRTVRALADNRICGGRLNWPEPKLGQKRAVAQSLLLDAWREQIDPSNSERVYDPATRQSPFLRDRPDLLLVNGAPSPAVTNDEEIRDRSRPLLHVLRVFFPEPVAPQLPEPARLTRGETIYDLWQSRIDVFHNTDTRPNFQEAHIMRGAPGAMVAAGLAVFVGNHLRVVGETDAAYSDRVAIELLALSMEPGDLLQFWSRITDFEAASRFGMPSNTVLNGYGHSPVFAGYTGSLTGDVLQVIDQYGTSLVRLTGQDGSHKLRWSNEDPELVWIAAKWTE